ncbi:hypothetical protein [Mycobacterium intracellulare]|uniref:hypothetical protein n=1 Tax=Mycobacterium intracellulare TaxID=1767 RepID=UPI0034D42D18
MSFGYFNPTERVLLTNPAGLADLYVQAVTADAATGFTAMPPVRWTDTRDDIRRLEADWSEAKQKLQVWAQTSVVKINGCGYRGHTLDQSRAATAL